MIKVSAGQARWRLRPSRSSPTRRALWVALGGGVLVGGGFERHPRQPSLYDDVAVATPTASEAAVASVPAHSQENLVAFAEAVSVLDAAIAAPLWTAQDRAAFQQARRRVTREHHRELMLRLTRAINDQQLPYAPASDD